ncbi:hypothetical protein Vretimale_17740 [Volvox reticuliferus]|uniref:Dirigent protein n=1 Tax=Volvox reticuliferus TaxID=1737510 RepID=A0A8J4G082_9CHLO|nr:hypothetical protein Vretifemale_18973 [Volvox reticuliferus]GIM14863.1 hypothetical protein Vretimale_17740 [Volvox reticuliferus]
MIHPKHFTLVVFVVVVAFSSYTCSAARKSPPPTGLGKPDYCKKTFNVVVYPNADSFIFFTGTGVLQRGSAFSFGLGIFPVNSNQTIGNLYGQGTVIDVRSLAEPAPIPFPETYFISFVNFNVVSPVGQIASQGIWDDQLSATNSFPVTGGTGLYTDAAGTLDMVVVGASTYYFTVKLTKASC